MSHRATGGALLQHSGRDVVPGMLAGLQGALLATTAPLQPAGAPGAAAAWGLAFAVGLWWGSNTIAHHHLHNPLFRSRRLNRAFALYLTALVGIPQTVWKRSHLRHHAGARASERPIRLDRAVATEVALIGGLWGPLLVLAPAFLLFVYLPAWGAGLALCSLQGHYEHVGGVEGGISHRGRLYNLLWLNDGFHAEHHRWPRLHWTRLPDHALPEAPSDPFPPFLRWLSGARARLLERLEGLALRWPRLQRAMLRTHARAFEALLGGERPRHVLVVGGGLFPRSVRILRQLRPDARLTILDASAAHLDRARRHLAEAGVPLDGVAFRRGRYHPNGSGDGPDDADLVVVPLALDGDRRAVLRPGAVPRLVHAWAWEPRGEASAPVSPWLLKRLTRVPAA